MLTIDEADDFYRTDGESNHPIKLEEALSDLKELGPLVCFEVSATLLAIFMAQHREGDADAVAAADLWYVDPCDDYVGAELLMPPTDSRGDYVFLHEHDLKKSNTHADSKVRAVYADAASKPRSLLLDATTSAVTAASQIGILPCRGQRDREDRQVLPRTAYLRVWLLADGPRRLVPLALPRTQEGCRSVTTLR